MWQPHAPQNFGSHLPALPIVQVSRQGGEGSAQQTPGEVLGALDTLCMYRIEDWWTYELCYKRSVRQFHKEGNKVGCPPGLVVLRAGFITGPCLTCAAHSVLCFAQVEHGIVLIVICKAMSPS